MPIDTMQPQIPASNKPWWQSLGQGLQNMLGNVSFQSGPNGYSFSASGGGNNMLPTPPSTGDLTNWLPYLVGGAVLFKLLK